jgi:Protein of unknown function (DUF1652)
MAHDFSLEAALQIIGSAFSPLQCSAGTENHGNGVYIRAVDESGETVLDTDGLTRQMVTDARRLKSIIADARAHIAHQGVSLSPWQFPEAS